MIVRASIDFQVYYSIRTITHPITSTHSMIDRPTTSEYDTRIVAKGKCDA